MQIHPSNWDALLLQPHITQYRFTVNGSVMAADFIQGVPTIEKPMMLEPVIGRCCTGSLTIDIRQSDSGAIPKAASVAVDCRLSSYDKTIASDWIPQGRFIITQRSGYGDMVTLTCRDGMILAGKTYLDKKGISTWPASMSDVLTDIARIMGVEIDSRTQIQTGEEYMISTPEEDVLMSEILGKIAAVHGGNFIMTESGKLRLVPFPSTSEPVYDLKQEYKTYTPYSSGDNTISRIILKNAEGQQYTVGDDTGVWITGEFDTATQAMTDILSGGEYTLLGGTYYLPSGSISSGTAIITDEGLTVDSETGTASTVLNGLLGRKYTPYRLDGAYIDPCIELGDTFAIMYRGQVLRLIANTMTINCTTGYTCRVENGIMYDDEEEVVYTTPKERQQERTAARAARNTSRIAREEKRAQDAEDGITTTLEKLDGKIIASVTKEELGTTLKNYLEIDDLSSEMGSVFTNGDTTLAATITTLINTLNGEQFSEAHISADVITLDGYVTVDDISAGKTYTGSLSVTGTLGADTVGAGTVQAQTLQLAADNEGNWDTYTPLLVKINGSSTGVWMLGTNATGTEFDITGIGGITNAEIIDGHTLKLTKADASVINFRKATALHTSTVSADGQQKNAGWNSGTYTVIATQTNVVTATGQSETNEVGRTSTTLKTIAVEGTPTQGTVMKKNMNAVLKVLYDNGDPESDGTDTGMNPQTVGIDATPVYNYGWGEARKAVKWPTAGITNAYMDVEVPSATVDGTPEKKRFHVRSTQNDAYITIEGPNDTWTDYAHVEHNQYNLGRGSVNVTVGQNGDITYTPPTGEQSTHSVQNCGTYNVPIKAMGDNDDSDSTTISFDPEAAWSDGYTTGVSSGSSSGYTDGQNNTLVVKGTWSNGSITFSTNAPNPVSGSSKTLQILSGSQVGSLNNAGTAIDFAVLEHVGTDNEVRTGATISAAINNKSLSVSGTHSGNGVYALSGTGNVRVGGVNIGLTGSGTLTATEAIRHGTSLVTIAAPTWTGSNGVTIGGQTGQNKYQYQLKTSGRVDADGNANEDVYYLNPTQAFTHGFNICYNSIGLSEVSKDLEPGTEITIYPKAKGTYDAAQATNITSKGITIKAKSAPSVSDRYYEGKNSVTLNDPTWSPYTGSGYPGSRTVTVKTSGRTNADGTAAAELQKDVALYLSQGDWSNNKKTVYLRTGNATNGTIYASTEVNAESIYSAGKYSVTVTGASIEANSVVYSGRTARGNMLVRLSNMDDDDPDIRLTGIILDPVYQSGLDGGNDYQTTADFEFDLTDGTDDEWSGYYEDVNVSMVYQQGVHDRTPATPSYYVKTSGGPAYFRYSTDNLDRIRGWLYARTEVTRLGVSGNYTQISFDGVTGYIRTDSLEYVTEPTSPTNFPGKTGWSSYADVGYHYHGKIKMDNVNLREDATTSSRIILKMPNGADVYGVFDPDTLPPDNMWNDIIYVKSEHDLYLGYVDWNYVNNAQTEMNIVVNWIQHSTYMQAYNVTVRTAAGDSVTKASTYTDNYAGLAVTPGADPSAYLTADAQGNYATYTSSSLSGSINQKINLTATYTESNGTTISETVTLEVAAAPESSVEYVYIYASGNNNYIHLRKSPSTSAADVGLLKCNTKVQLLSYSNGWAHVYYLGYDGYVQCTNGIGSNFVYRVKKNNNVVTNEWHQAPGGGGSGSETGDEDYPYYGTTKSVTVVYANGSGNTVATTVASNVKVKCKRNPAKITDGDTRIAVKTSNGTLGYITARSFVEWKETTPVNLDHATNAWYNGQYYTGLGQFSLSVVYEDGTRTITCKPTTSVSQWSSIQQKALATNDAGVSRAYFSGASMPNSIEVKLVYASTGVVVITANNTY